MKKISTLIALFLVIFYSCNTDDDSDTINNTDWDLEEASGLFLEFNNSFGFLNEGGTDFKYIYENGKVVKKRGGVTNYENFLMFSDEIYDYVTYTNNQIIVKTKRQEIKEEQETEYNTTTNVYTLENNKIVKSINSSYKKDTIKYYYTGDLLTKQIFVNNSAGIRQQSNFYYNAKGNLDSIVNRNGNLNQSTHKFDPININSRERFVEIFDKYDNYANPTKNLGVFPELFKRSLSKNNFGRYQIIVYLSTPEKYTTSYIEFPMKYENERISFKF